MFRGFDPGSEFFPKALGDFEQPEIAAGERPCFASEFIEVDVKKLAAPEPVDQPPDDPVLRLPLDQIDTPFLVERPFDRPLRNEIEEIVG